MVTVVQVFIVHQLLATISGAFGQGALIHAVIQLNGSRDSILKMISEQLENHIQLKTNNWNSNDKKKTDVENTPSKSATETTTTVTLVQVYAAALLLGGPLSIQGNITADSSNSDMTTIRITLHTNLLNTNAKLNTRGLSLQNEMSNLLNNDEQKKQDTVWGWDNTSQTPDSSDTEGGILKSIVGVMEPYILTILNIIFHGIMTSVVTKIMDNANMTGDVRLS